MTDYNSQHTGSTIDERIAAIPTIQQAVSTINAGLTQETTNRQSADAAMLARLRGDENYHDNYQDPLLVKIFSTPDPQTDPFSGRRDLAAYLDTLHTSDASNLKPVGLLRLNIDGSALWAISNVRSFADDVWTQVLLNAYVDSNGIGAGTAMYVRESKPISERTSDVWNAWERCSLSTSETVSLITAALQGNYATLIDGKVPASQLPTPTVVTDISSTTRTITVTDTETVYYLGTLTSLSITGIGNRQTETRVFFTAGANCELSIARPFYLAGGISITEGKHYVMAIISGAVVVTETTYYPSLVSVNGNSAIPDVQSVLINDGSYTMQVALVFSGDASSVTIDDFDSNEPDGYLDITTLADEQTTNAKTLTVVIDTDNFVEGESYDVTYNGVAILTLNFYE